MKTVARGSSRATVFGSKRSSQSILAPARSAPCEATKRPWTWKIGSAWTSTSPPSSGERQCQYVFSVSAFESRLPWVSIAPLLRPVVPLV